MTPNLKEFQVQILIRDGSDQTIRQYLDTSLGKVEQLFSADDLYIESYRVGGMASATQAVNLLLSQSQSESIALSFGRVILTDSAVIYGGP